jgi:uncharacterized membrane protein
MTFNSRVVAGLVMVALFVMGAVAGGMATSLFRRDPPPPWVQPPFDGSRTRPPRGPVGPRSVLPAQYLERLERQLGLSGAQRDSIEAILELQREQAESTLRDLEPRLRASVDSALAQVRAVLDAEQQEEFDSLVVRDREILGRRMLPGGPPGPRGGGG